MKLKRTLTKMGLGAALAYLFDPRSGRSRREQLMGRSAQLRESARGIVDRARQRGGEDQGTPPG